MLGRKGILAASIGLAATLVLGGCAATSATDTSAPSTDGSSSANGVNGELTIFAAASLTGSFTDLAEGFEAQNPGVTVTPISFDGSSTLATQILEGAPVDVFASADEANMMKLESVVAGSPDTFTTNTMQIVVAPGNPLGITSLADLTADTVQLVLCAPEVPCGSASSQLFDNAGVSVTPVSEEQNVKAVLTKVQAGEADAGLVYVTDVTAAEGSVDGVDISGTELVANAYQIATFTESKNPEAATAFIKYVLSPEGQAILAGYGFTAP